MTAKTTRGAADAAEERPAADEVAEVEAVETGDGEDTAPEDAAQAPAKPAARRKRRVRVIEVIDDEDLDEVLEALDAEDAAEAEEEPEPPARPAAKAPPAKPKPTLKTRPATKPTPKARPARIEEPEDETPDEESPAETAPARPTLFGLGLTQAVVVVVLVALLASLAIWQWRRASGMASEKDDRAAVSKVASAYGDVAFNYNASNYQTQTDKAQKLLGGDLLESFKSSTVPTLTNTFKTSPEVAVTSKTGQVFVGSVDGRFATAVIMVDIQYKNKDGAVSAPATLLRLALAKIDGTWKVTKQYPSGVNDQNQNQQSSGLPTTSPSGSTSPTPKSSGSPKN
ncbi:hypothetical protein [Actinomadura fibrosa]|uniref:Mce-associated membrane protein n=1 Tax=Actinomadura fibrosa TaxID=111802 RepID=A0ABW2XP38_9ACTN|nr:hypothetical protein [Actinomadura fibrosa]